jgi:hypothetical protein
MNRITIIQDLINKYKYTSYLEIGIFNKDCFNAVNCTEKTGVDPGVSSCSYNPPDKGYQLTSDEFFSSLSSDVKYDIIFIDGLHTEEQVDRDLANCIKHLSENGTIVLHDCSPDTEALEDPHWCGTVWKSVYKFRKNQKDYEGFVVNVDHGCGVIQKKKSTFSCNLEDSVLSYSFLNNNRKEVLNLKTPEEFEALILD